MDGIKFFATKNSNNQWELIRRTPRWLVGLVLVATGTGKALDIPGFTEVLAAYDLLPD